MSKPIAITLGDPAGVGPEIVAKMLAQPRDLQDQPWLLVGPHWALRRGAEAASVTLPDLPRIQQPEQLTHGFALYDIDVAEPADFAFGQVQAACGKAGVEAVEWSARGCLAGTLQAMVTAPLNKESVHAAGYVNDIGHQEILARLSGVDWTATMLMTPGLRVAHLSTHKSLIEAARYVTADNVLSKLKLVHQTVSEWGIDKPRIAVAALNPHGGEGGLLGREELDELTPAVQQAQALGIAAVGPIPADSVFNRAIAGEFDVVLALYHDQGHIAIKVHDFHRSTTATLGIPFIRTSVDHGTAFDIAGQGVADPTGLIAAMEMALDIAQAKLA